MRSWLFRSGATPEPNAVDQVSVGADSPVVFQLEMSRVISTVQNGSIVANQKTKGKRKILISLSPLIAENSLFVRGPLGSAIAPQKAYSNDQAINDH